MIRTAIYSSICVVLIGVSVLLLVFTLESHKQYAKAHATAHDAIRATTGPSTLPGSLVSPDHYYVRAWRFALGICAIAVIALIVTVRTRHLVWLACFLTCGVLATIAVMRAGVRI